MKITLITAYNISQVKNKIDYIYPEAGLHPSYQTKWVNNIKKSCVIFTYSEHIFYALRILSKNGIAEVNAIFYDDKDDIHNIKIDSYGGVDGYPRGFFDESDKSLDELIGLG